MTEKDSRKEDDGTLKHALYLTGLIMLGLVFYSIAAYVGLEFARNSTAERESDASIMSPSSETTAPVEAGSKSDDGNDGS